MATYIKGVQDYIPKLEPFKPDYKFLSDVLDVRQDRYDTNYKQLNDLYSRVVYAPMSREDNIAKREQYANQLSNGLKQVSGMDLSLAPNVDAAKALFRPFFEDKALVKDMAFTNQFKKQMDTANFYAKSPDENDNDRWWQDGIQNLNYQMKDYKAATPEAALSQGLPQYVDNPNLYERAFEILKESELSMTADSFSEDGQWIITQKNGTSLTRRQIGYKMEEDGKTEKLDANGNKIPIYDNPAMNFLKGMLLKDPIVNRGYLVQANNRAREFYEDENNIKKYGSIDAAKKHWAETILKTGTDKEQLDLAEQTTRVEADRNILKRWEDYQKTKGIIPGSDEEKTIQEKIFNLSIAEATVNMTQERVKNQKSPAEDISALMNLAYATYMGMEMGPLLAQAATAYSQIGAERTIEENPYFKMELKFEYDKALKAMQYEIDMDKINAKAQNAWDLQERKFELEASQVSAGGPLMFGDGTGVEVGPGDVVYGGSTETGLYGNPFETNRKEQKESANQIRGNEIEFIKMFANGLPNTANNSDIFGNAGTTIKYMHKENENSQAYEKTASIDEALKDLQLPQNKGEWDRIWQGVEGMFVTMEPGESGSYGFTEIPELKNNPTLQSLLKNQYNSLSLQKVEFIRVSEEMQEAYTEAYNYSMTKTSSKNNAQFGYPTLMPTEREIAMYKDGYNPFTIETPANVWGGRNHQLDHKGHRGESWISDPEYQQYDNLDNTTRRIPAKAEYIEMFVASARGPMEYANALNDKKIKNNKETSGAGPLGLLGQTPRFADHEDWPEVFEKYPMMKKYWSFEIPQPGNASQAVAFGSLTLGQSWTFPDEWRGEWVFDEKQARKDAAKYYDGNKNPNESGEGGQMGNMINIMNDELSSENGLPGFSWRQSWTGQDYEGSGASLFRTYSTHYDHVVKEPNSANMAKIVFFDIPNMPKANYTFAIGDQRGTDPSKYSIGNNKEDYNKVKLIHDFIQSDLVTDYGKRDDKTGHPVLNIEYVEEAGGVDNPGWAAYHVTFPPEYSKKFSGSEAGGTAPFEADEFKEIMKNGYTVFLGEEYDSSPFKYVNRPRSSVGSYIKQNASPYGDVFDGGGEFYIFEVGKNKYMRKINTYGYDKESGNMVPDGWITDPQVYDEWALDNLRTETEEALKQIAIENISQQTKK